MADTLDLVGQEAERAEQERREAHLAQQRKLDMAYVMGTVGGRRFIWELVCTCGLWAPSFTGNDASTDFREGQRNVALQLWARVQLECRDLFRKMIEENQLG